MSDEAVVEAPRITVGFERKVDLGNYNSATASIYVQAPTTPDDDADARVAAIQAAMFEAKVAVFDALGITFDVTVDGKAVEKFTQELGGVEVTREDEARATAQASSATTQRTAAAPQDDDARWAELCSNPKKWFDNREGKRSPKAPDFKRKGTGDALWLEKNGKSNVPERLMVPVPSAFK